MPRRSNSEMEMLRAEAVRLRLEERMPLAEIYPAVGVAKGTAIRWLRGYPLTTDELREHRERRTRSDAGLRRKPREADGKWWEILQGQALSNAERGRVAEAAVAFRLAVHGFEIYGSYFDGARVDLIVDHPQSQQLLKVQVKCTGNALYGLPSITVQRSVGAAKRKVKYDAADCDFIVGYDLRTDIAYVYSFEELKSNRSVLTVSPDAAEAWYKLRDAVKKPERQNGV